MSGITRNLHVDAVRIQKAAQALPVNDTRLEKEPGVLPSSRAACLKGQRNQVLGIDNANEYPLVLMHTRRVNRIYDERIVRRQDLNRDTVDEHVLGVNRGAGISEWPFSTISDARHVIFCAPDVTAAPVPTPILPRR